MTRREKNWKDQYKELLLGTERSGMHRLIFELERRGFFTCPCSTEYHLCRPGGLVEHSLNVYELAHDIWVTRELQDTIPEDSITIAALLHDIGKMGDHGIPNYILNETGNIAKPYVYSDLPYIPHEVRSIIIAQRYIELTPDEEYAIYYHNGKYTNIGATLKKHTPLEMIIHFADLYSCFETEKEKNYE